MITKHSDWELGAYLYEYNGGTFSSVDITQPITLLSETFFNNCTESYINKKFFYFDLSKDTYFLKTNVEFILRFVIPITTSTNNNLYSMTGYYINPLQLKIKLFPDLSAASTANISFNYKSGIYITNSPKWIASKNNSFYVSTISTDTVTINNNNYGFLWSLLLRQI